MESGRGMGMGEEQGRTGRKGFWGWFFFAAVFWKFGVSGIGDLFVSGEYG